MECERERRNIENTKMNMHEELLSNMARRKAREIFEMERKRKIEEMKRLTETVSEEGIAMAETNDKLSQVHADLKNAFQRMRVRRREKTLDRMGIKKKKNKIKYTIWKGCTEERKHVFERDGYGKGVFEGTACKRYVWNLFKHDQKLALNLKRSHNKV